MQPANLKPKCQCRGATGKDACIEYLTGEDMLCDNCRENQCEALGIELGISKLTSI